jgi:ABC-type sugar transport system ATPase subunit
MTDGADARGLTKTFGTTRALDGVDFSIVAGEIHALVGENGAGKSTLVRILGGVHRPDTGEIVVGGTAAHFSDPHDAIAAGIVTIPQELRLVPALSIAENIALGDLPVRRLLGLLSVIDRAEMREQARAILAQLEFSVDPDRRVERLSFAERQLVAIAKALRRRCKVLILDEPTAALESREVARLFAILARLKAQGTAIVYVSHRLEEIVTLADRCTVLRDGKVVAVARRGEFSVADLVHAMSGRDNAARDQRISAIGDVLLEEIAKGTDAIQLRAGEAIGLAGLLGSGSEAILRRLFGMEGRANAVRVRGKTYRVTDPRTAIAAGIGMIPGERRLGLIMNQSVRDNILLPSLDRLRRGGMVDRAAGERLVVQLMELFDIRPRRPELPAAALSGGNQQRVILAKWIARNVDVLIADEPTQGVDIGAKAHIHGLIRNFVREGGGVLISSSDLAELTQLCDSVLALRQGKIVTRMARGEFDDQRLRTAIGG